MQAFGARSLSQQSESHQLLPQPRRPAPAPPLLDTPVQRSHSASSLSGNPFLDVELSTPTHAVRSGPAHHHQGSHHLPAASGGSRLGNDKGTTPAGEGKKGTSARGPEIVIPPAPDSYSAMMSPSESPLVVGQGGIGAMRGTGAGNPFVALGHAGRALAAKFNTYKPLRLPSGVPGPNYGAALGEESAMMLQQGHANPLFASRYAPSSCSPCRPPGPHVMPYGLHPWMMLSVMRGCSRACVPY